MPKLPPQKINERKKWLRQIVRHHFGTKAMKVEFKPTGLTNSVFQVTASGEKYIIRIGESPDKLQDFYKEQWVTRRAGKAGVPVAKILEIGDQLIPGPYMIQQSVEGDTAIDHPEVEKILLELGRLAKTIHSIRTENFGRNFNWSEDVAAKRMGWKDFMVEEVMVFERLQWLEQHKILQPLQRKRLKKELQKMVDLKRITPHLAHGDLRLKNVIADKKGKIKAILDWEESLSTNAPLWDMAIALHDLSVDQKEAFLKGYNISTRAFEKMSSFIKVLNTLLYTQTLEALEKENKKRISSLYRLRLNGYFDLYFSND